MTSPDFLIERWLASQSAAVCPSTLDAYRSALRSFTSWLDLQSVSLKAVDAETLSSWLAFRRQEGVRGGRLRFCLGVVRRWHSWLVDCVDVGAKPIRGKLARIRTEKPEKHAFTREQYEQLRRVLLHPDFDWSPFWADAVTVAWETGLRCSDVAGLTWDCVSLQPGILTVRPIKKRLAGEKLEIPIGSGLANAFASLYSDRRIDDYRVLPRMQHLYRYRRQALANEFRKICDAAGLPKHSFHSLRHGFVTRLLEAGVDPITIGSMTGQTLEVIKGYAHIGHEAKVRALEKANRKEEA